MIENAVHLERLRNAYPRLFVEDGMLWGFEHGPGWDALIESLCAEIDGVLKELPTATITIRQVKETMGALRFYYRLQGVDDDHASVIQHAVNRAYAQSERTCEQCGRVGSLQQTASGVKTLCATCHADIESNNGGERNENDDLLLVRADPTAS